MFTAIRPIAQPTPSTAGQEAASPAAAAPTTTRPAQVDRLSAAHGLERLGAWDLPELDFGAIGEEAERLAGQMTGSRGYFSVYSTASGSQGYAQGYAGGWY